MDRNNSQPIQRGRPVSGMDAAYGNEYFEQFLNASSLKHILGYYRGLIDNLHLKPNVFPLFYPKLRANLTSWRAKALWKKFDARASHKCYQKGKAASNTRVLIIGGGPCGLRAAIEAQLLGAKVVLIEKRDRFSRNNVLHLWPFVIEDLRMLGAKKFFGKFCAGAIDHISIRRLQCILLKVALLLGVEVHTEVSFEKLIEPNATEKTGWKAEIKPINHPVSQYEFDVILGADGKRNTLQGFTRKEFRGKLAIAITANFINKKTEAEARVEEISGVAFIFNQKFFKDLQGETRIDLENIVYYKDDTHYFVMTAKKASLIEKGVIKQDLADTEKLLAPENVDRVALENYAIEAANFSTNYQMPDLEFAVNHYGHPDIAMFDFTSMFAADNASKVVERDGYRLLTILVGDSLLEPFWPTGSGCARGFLSSLDAAWAIRSWSMATTTPLDVLAERESIYRLLAQTTPDNLNKDWKSYTLDPATRYPNLNKAVVLPQQTVGLYDTDNPTSIERMKRNSQEKSIEVPKKRRRGNVDNEVLLNWISEQLRDHDDITVTDIGSIFKDGKVLCAIVHHYRPDLLDYNSVKDGEPANNNQIAFDIYEKELGIPPIMTGEEVTGTEDYLTMASYLTLVYDTFRGEIPHIKQPKLDLPESNKRSELSFKTSNMQAVVASQPSRPSSRHKRHADAMIPNKVPSIDRKTRKRRTLERVGASVEERQKMLEEISSNRTERQNRRRQQRKLQTEQFLKSMQMLQANAPDSEPFEDYSIFLYRQTAPKFEDRVKDLEKQFTYVPDHENKVPNLASRGGGTDEDLAARIKSLENKWRDPQPVDKKPKDLLRAIGKIETSDWNIKEIEKKILENKLGKPSKAYDKEKVPKWSKEQFLARQTKMEKQHLDRQDSAEAKFADIDRSIKHLDQKLKEGTVRELGQNKVAFITEKLVSKVPTEPKTVEKNNVRPPASFAIQGSSELCHFCSKRVYLMERLSAEGRFFHHGCFKCQYCHTQLRLGSYAFDREGQYGHKFFCIHHYGMVGEITPAPKVTRKPSQRTADSRISPEKKPLSGVAGVDLLDRVQTPERIEFSNLSGNISSDQEESLSQMDEDEWTDKNFGASCAEMGDSEDDSSSISDTESDDEDAFDDALEEPVTKEGTMKWAERWKNSYSRKRHDSNGYSSSDQSSYYENSSDDDDSETATEGEEEIRARELRKQEVCVEPPVVQTDTGTDTEVVSDESSSESSSEIQNSATEISTDSEFAHDDPTPTREIPAIFLNDFNVTKVRGSGGNVPKKIQVTSGYLQKPSNGKTKKPNIELKLRPLVPSAPTIKKPAPVLLQRTEGYALNRTQSTGGIAAKVSLELKKKYLLGESAGSIQKSGSASTLDSKFKTFRDTISDCQKLLKPAPEISASMQTFCDKLNERHSPILSPQSSAIFSKTIENKLEELKEKPPPPDVTNVKAASEEVPEPVFQNESEGRPRSPVHETSIIVPNIDWSKKNQSNSSDSLCTSSSDNELVTTPNHQYDNIPRVEVYAAKENDTKDNIPPDSLCLEAQSKSKIENCLQADPPKSITSEKKTLNQPKSLPNVDILLPEIHNSLHMNLDKTDIKNASGLSSPDSGASQVTAALTETELSDWARDGVVSDDFEDVEFNLNKVSKETYKGTKEPRIPIQIANIQEFDDISHICGKEKQDRDWKNKTIITETVNSILNENLDSIEFMDTGTETSSDDGVVDSQDGYVLFKDEDDFAEDSLNPNINEIIDTRNICVDDKFPSRNTGYCILNCDDKELPGTVIDLKPSDVEKLKRKQLADPEEDSLVIVETGTTTEENTCSDSTVKNITEISLDKNRLSAGEPPDIKNDNLQKQRLEEKLAKVKAEAALEEQSKMLEAPVVKENVDCNMEFEEHCQRLQSKVEFGNVKDSIDIRKSRRKSKSDSPQKPDLIQEEKSSPLHSTKDNTLNLKLTAHTPDIVHKKEILKKERDINQKLIQEMVMNKMKAENKSLERKKRTKTTPSNVYDPYELSKSISTDVSAINLDDSNRNSVYSTGSSTYTTPDVLLSTNLIPLQNSQSVNTVPDINSSSDIFSTPLSSLKEQNIRTSCVTATCADKMLEKGNPNQHADNFRIPEVRKYLFSEDAPTPNPPPRQNKLLKDEANKTAEKLKKDAKAKAKLLTNEELGLSPEEKLLRLREKISRRGKENENVDPHIQESIESLVMNTEKKNSWLYSNDTLSKKKNNSFKRSKSGDCATSNSKLSSYSNTTESKNAVPVRTKSVSEFTKNSPTVKPEDAQNVTNKKICLSDSNLLDTVYVKPKKKSKEREQKKSITKLLSTLFTKKSPSTSSKRLFSKLSPKSKDISKEIVEEPIRRKSLSDVFVHRNIKTPPPIPPLPLHYTVKGTDDSSDGEHELRKQDHSSCDTLDQSGMLEYSTSSLTGRKANKSMRRVARQAQLKRHRMAQEIQRKLEETEVKTRELEARGVLVEKILRGEDSGACTKDESELLQEWFDLMRDLTELRRYEKELMVRAQELELEDRHARLQHELRERLENNELKTEEDVMAEEFIINEMMEIVSKRDSLISVIEEDRLRYSNEDRDLEEQMLAKGLRLTPIRKSP